MQLHVTLPTYDSDKGHPCARNAVLVVTEDGVRLAGFHLRAAGAQAGTPAGRVVVLAHGFTGSAWNSSSLRIADRLARFADVVCVDFRGHGRSGGRSSVGGDGEVRDLDAVVRWVRRPRDEGGLDAESVATVGLSMGAVAALRHAGARGGVDAVVSVSAVSRWYVRDTPPMRKIHWLLESPIGPLTSRFVLRTRLGAPWTTTPDGIPVPPLELVGAIAPTPLLIVHGTADSYLPMEHPRALAAAAGPAAELWEIAGYGHAGGAMTPALVDRIGRWIAAST